MKIAPRWLVITALLWIGPAPSAAAPPLGGAGRPGDTVAVSVGWQRNLSRQNVAITITPSSGAPVSYLPGDPGIRAVVNVYPDPVSRLRAGSPGGGQEDWWDTAVYFDMPIGLAAGTASVQISGPGGLLTPEPIAVEVLPGVTRSGPPGAGATAPGTTESDLAPLERVEHVTVTFAGPAVPHSIQLQLHYTPAASRAGVVNPRGDVKNLVWADHGTTLTVLLTPAGGVTPQDFGAFSFYVTGALADLHVTSLRAYDIRGTQLADVSARIE